MVVAFNQWPYMCLEFSDRERLLVSIHLVQCRHFTDGDAEAQRELACSFLTQGDLPLGSAAQPRGEVEEGGGGPPQGTLPTALRHPPTPPQASSTPGGSGPIGGS